MANHKVLEYDNWSSFLQTLLGCFVCVFLVNKGISRFWIDTFEFFRQYSEAVARRCSVKKVFLDISQNSQENTCTRVWACDFIKKETLAQMFCKIRTFAKFLTTSFRTKHLRWLLLSIFAVRCFYFLPYLNHLVTSQSWALF